RDYAASHSIFASLAAACAAQLGAVWSYGDDGHPIRYHTDCGVLTNNFLITPQHRRKMAEAGEYLAMTPRQFVDAAPHLRYVLVRMVQLFEHTADGLRSRTASEVAARNAPLFVALTFDDNLPSEYRLVDELRLDDERTFPYIRVFEIVRE
ncbi:MAG: hypothetical protein ACE5F8_09520, partial [Woeseiaceae bacterium]